MDITGLRPQWCLCKLLDLWMGIEGDTCREGLSESSYSKRGGLSARSIQLMNKNHLVLTKLNLINSYPQVFNFFNYSTAVQLLYRSTIFI